MKINFWKDYFTFTKKERTAVLVLIALIVTIFLLPHWIPDQIGAAEEAAIISIGKKLTDQEANEEMDKTDTRADGYKQSNVSPYRESGGEKNGRLFLFDPNTITDAQWRELGVKEKTISTIRRYLSKGGKFRKPDDIKKVYGLSRQKAEELVNYVQIPEQTPPSKPPMWRAHHSQSFPEKAQLSKQLIDVNTADTSSFIALPGIGSKLAKRIILFRDKLGGFYSADQVKEVYGLPDSTFNNIRTRLEFKSPNLRLIDLNAADVQVLAQHPYIGRVMARAIIAFRDQHGGFNAVEELKNIHLVTEEVFNKLSPYLRVGSVRD